MNTYINKFNQLSNKIEIRQIRKENGRKLIIPSSNNISTLKNQELNIQDRIRKTKKKLKFLDEYYNEYEKETNILEILYNNRKKYSKAVEQCRINKKINTKLTELTSDYLIKEKK
ncbi:MAG TPA: hypothetical protein DIU45_15485, partial [Clostridium sp.]|nr:hypothetical protein [Clostridium sp.]